MLNSLKNARKYIKGKLMKERVFVTASADFEAACQIGIFPESHRARALHGHSYKASIRLAIDDSENDNFDQLEVTRELLQDTCGLLDYSYLNEIIDVPTDENVARYIKEQTGLSNINVIGLTSQSNEGVHLDEYGAAHVWRRFRFESAHRLPNVPSGHKCGRMHGHGFEVILHTQTDLRQSHLGVDYDEIQKHWEELHQLLHHNCLNDISGLENPTSEMISFWIWSRLKRKIPQLSWVTVYETSSSGSHYNGSDFRIWKDFSIDSAIRLDRVKETDTRKRIHGHTYLCRLHLTAPLNDVLGWTIDYGDVKEKFNPIFDKLDHKPLYEIAELADNDPFSIVRWIKANSASQLVELERIDLFETLGCGVTIDWGALGPALPI